MPPCCGWCTPLWPLQAPPVFEARRHAAGARRCVSACPSPASLSSPQPNISSSAPACPPGPACSRFLKMARRHLDMGVPYFIDREFEELASARGLRVERGPPPPLSPPGKGCLCAVPATGSTACCKGGVGCSRGRVWGAEIKHCVARGWGLRSAHVRTAASVSAWQRPACRPHGCHSRIRTFARSATVR